MPRLTELDDVLFPVDVHPVFVRITDKNGERRVAVPEKKAIVNRTTRRVLGVVSRGYRLVTNREALDMAYECCRTVFPETKHDEWEAKAVDAPSTAGYCRIDLVHNTTALDFSFLSPNKRADAFGTFIRVTNSFNGLRALGFDIGFYRKVCTNGLIIPESIIRFKFSHQRRDIGEKIHFEIAKERLTKFTTTFTDSLSGLRNCAVPQDQFEPLIAGALLLKPPRSAKPDPSEVADWRQLCRQLSEMSTRYVDELGENAYAVFNVMTELASRPPENRCIHRDRHSLQRLAGSWLTSFNDHCSKPGFSISRYLEQLEEERASAIETMPNMARTDRRRAFELVH